MRRIYLSSIVALAVLLAQAAAPINSRADTIFSDFGTGNSFSATGWVNVNQGQFAAAAFTPSGNFTLSQVDIALSWYGIGTNGAIVELVNGAGGVPGSLSSPIESWTLTGLPASGYPYVAEPLVSSGPAVTLLSGTQYWVVAEPLDSTALDTWNVNLQSYYGYAYTANAQPTWYYVNYLVTPAFDVLGTPSSPTPEPSTLLLLGMGLVALMGLSPVWRKVRG